MYDYEMRGEMPSARLYLVDTAASPGRWPDVEVPSGTGFLPCLRDNFLKMNEGAQLETLENLYRLHQHHALLDEESTAKIITQIASMAFGLQEDFNDASSRRAFIKVKAAQLFAAVSGVIPPDVVERDNHNFPYYSLRFLRDVVVNGRHSPTARAGVMEVIGHYPTYNTLQFLQTFRGPGQPAWLAKAAESALRRAFVSAIEDISLYPLRVKRTSACIIIEIYKSGVSLSEEPSPVPALLDLVKIDDFEAVSLGAQALAYTKTQDVAKALLARAQQLADGDYDSGRLSGDHANLLLGGINNIVIDIVRVLDAEKQRAATGNGRR